MKLLHHNNKIAHRDIHGDKTAQDICKYNATNITKLNILFMYFFISISIPQVLVFISY